MGGIFGELYSRWYDTFYEHKDYATEVDFILRMAADNGMTSPNEALDLGCGTGGHALPMLDRGLRVTGVDFSEGMLDVARARTAGTSDAQFVQGDVRDTDIGTQFDIVVMMFAVLGYQIGNEDVVAALRTIARHLTPDGVGVLDFWYGPAVLSLGPADRVNMYRGVGDSRLVRASRGVLNTETHTCDVSYRLIECGSGSCVDAEEVHTMRYFFPMEIRLMAEVAGLEVLDLVPAPGEVSEGLGVDTWNAAAVVRAAPRA